MTRQLVYIVTLDDVERIRFRCRTCDHVASVPVKSQPRQFKGECSNCGATWSHFDSVAYKRVLALLAAFADLPRQSEHEFGCVVELEIAEEGASLTEFRSWSLLQKVSVPPGPAAVS